MLTACLTWRSVLQGYKGERQRPLQQMAHDLEKEKREGRLEHKGEVLCSPHAPKAFRTPECDRAGGTRPWATAGSAGDTPKASPRPKSCCCRRWDLWTPLPTLCLGSQSTCTLPPDLHRPDPLRGPALFLREPENRSFRAPCLLNPADHTCACQAAIPKTSPST